MMCLNKRLMLFMVVVLASVMIVLPLAHGAKEFKVNPNLTVDQATMNFLKGYVDWCKNPEVNYQHSVGFAAVSNNANGVVGYAEGILVYKPDLGLFEGEATQYFNDRRSGYPMGHPFNPNKTDKIKMTLTPTGKGSITLLSWGNGIINVKFRTENNLLYGFSSPGQPSLWTVSLKKVSVGIPG